MIALALCLFLTILGSSASDLAHLVVSLCAPKEAPSTRLCPCLPKPADQEVPLILPRSLEAKTGVLGGGFPQNLAPTRSSCIQTAARWLVSREPAALGSLAL